MHKYNLKRAIYHIEQCDKWLEAYSKRKTNTSKVLIDHHIYLARFHIDKAKERGGIIDRDDDTMARNQSPRP